MKNLMWEELSSHIKIPFNREPYFRKIFMKNLLNNSLKGFIFLSGLMLALLTSKTILAQESDFAFFYELQFVKDTAVLEEKNNELMVLWVSEEKSLFQSYNGYLRDSVVNYYLDFARNIDSRKSSNAKVDLNKMTEEMNSYPSPIFSYKVFKDRRVSDVYTYNKLFRTNYRYKDGNTEPSWEILQETKKIRGYDSQLAISEYGGRRILAWFSEEIPISDGPYVFQGLPGLVMELYDADCHFHFSLVGVEKRQIDLESQLPKDFLKVEKVKFFAIEDEFRKNAFSQMSETDASKVSPSQAAQVQERLKSHNNRLELKIDK